MSLDISKNQLGAEGAKLLAKALHAQQHLVCDDGQLFKSKGVFARSICRHCGKQKKVHAARGALTSLNLADNDLEAEGAKHVAKAIKGHVSSIHTIFSWI